MQEYKHWPLNWKALVEGSVPMSAFPKPGLTLGLNQFYKGSKVGQQSLCCEDKARDAERAA